MLKRVSTFRLSSNNKWQWQIWTHAQDGWLGLRTGHLMFILYSSNEPGELLQWTTPQTLSQQLYKRFIRHADNTHTCSSQCCLKTFLFFCHGSHSLAYKIIQDFPGPHKFFQDSFIAQQCLNIQTNSSFYLLYIYNVTVTSSAKRSSKTLFG